MYKRKLFYFGLTTAVMLLIALFSNALLTKLNRDNIRQSNIANSLLIEHERLSSISYRLFKQLTDEVIFGKTANQAFVRNKQALISQLLDSIRQLEIEQREALGVQFTQGSVEDTDELARLINEIIEEFQVVVSAIDNAPLDEQERLRSLLEVTIDNQFREAINAAVTRQSSVVASINARINTLNSAAFGLSITLGLLSLPIILYGCYWLFNQLYQPLVVIRSAANAIASGSYDEPISEKVDEEFSELANSINQLALRLKEHEANELRSRKELEAEVQQRTSELTEANLELTKIDSRRREFIADVSHELRTPLTIIRGEAQVTLRMQSASQNDYRETLTAILQQSINLSHLVDDLLFLTRAEMAQIHLDKQPVKLAALLDEETQSWKRRLTDRSLSIALPRDLHDLTLNIDKSRVQQVLAVLLDNANKYSKPGGPIHIAAERKDSLVWVRISDEGDGISATEIENIFQRFVRFSKNNDGLGLGLPIAKTIIEAHGGEISVDSSPGEGSTFVFSLPVG